MAILIIGGAYQGKIDFVKNEYRICDSEIIDVPNMVKNNDNEFVMVSEEKNNITCEESYFDRQKLLAFYREIKEQILNNKVIYGYHNLIKMQLECGLNPIDEVKEIIKNNPDIFIICDEVGMGIVPLEKENRVYRDKVGEVLCALAKVSDRVIRVLCGIPEVIK